ncbi:MAG: carbohydrate-binding family 9-like protein [Planctomycetaceae bacterium]|nr:carbohydrate-binding family 9-like protein [Planctomycetaceae bacterium]
MATRRIRRSGSVGRVVVHAPAFLGALIFLAPALLNAEDRPMRYRVARVKPTDSVDARWDGEFWQAIEPLELRHFMGERPEHFPRVQAKLAYDDESVHVIFRVEDRYVRAVAKQHQDAVYRDSCVEFFWTPGDDISQGYFNLEMNCGGTMLLHAHPFPGQKTKRLADADLARIEVAHSLPKIVDPEITDPTVWTVAYRLPIRMFQAYFPGEIRMPGPGVTWRANLYKCADDSSHPHWLTWSPVDFERPDFHRPQSFGTLEFQ